MCPWDWVMGVARSCYLIRSLIRGNRLKKSPKNSASIVSFFTAVPPMTRLRPQIRHFLLYLLCVLPAAVEAQTSALSIDELSQRAGLIFAGTVIKIEPSDQGSVVRITFKV